MSDSTPLALLQTDQRQRWQRGERILVETYLEQRPELRADPDSLLDLIYSEIVLREEAGASPRFPEYRQRFPHLERQIRLLFEVHEVLEDEPLDKTHLVPGGRLVLPAASPTSGLPAGAVRIPGYEVLGELGRGGMGVVYKARQQGLNRLVALKMILAGAHAGPAQLARFRTEAEAAARLQHPNIVQIYQIDEQDGRPYFSLELVEGGNLQNRLGGAPQLPRRAAELLQTLARAMHYAHQRGIVHRDLKPSNVLLTADGTPKISDFGLAKLLDVAAGPTPTEAFLGTPNYMAPEQALGQSKGIGPPADIYALGAILYELLTGRPPFQGTTILETLEQVRVQEPVPVRRLQPKAPRDLETITHKCLDKDARRRYATAEDLAEDLRRFLAGEPITSRPTSRGRRLVKWARRRPAVATLIAVMALSLLGLVSASLWARAREAWRLADLRAEVQRAASAGQAAFANEDWAEARYQLGNALTRIGSEGALADLRVPLEAMHTEAGRRLSAREARTHADQVYREFLRLRDAALFHGMDALAPGLLLTGMDAAANRRAAGDAARAALALVGLDVERDSPWAPDARFTQAQAAEVKAGAYAVLLLLADVTAQEGAPARAGEGRYRKALRVLDRAEQIGPASRACALRRAHYLERLGERAAAERQCERAADLPLAGELDLFLAGQEHYRGGRLPEAVEDFRGALAARPRHFWAHCCLAVCDLRLQRWERAWRSLTFCLAERPEFVWARLLRGYALREAGALDAAALDLREAEEALARHPNAAASYSLRLHRGLLCVRRGRLAEAAAELKEAVRLRPEQYAAHLNLARVYQMQANRLLPGVGASAVATLGAPQGGPKSVLAASVLLAGRAYRQAEAAEQFRHALRAQPPALVLADYHAERARDLYLAGRYEDAIAASRLALKEQADYALALGVLAQALLELRRFEEAARAYDRYLAGGGRPVADIYRGRGQARMQLGDYLGAVADYTRVVERQPAAEIFAHRGWAYFFADAWRPALDDFEKALARDPAYGDAYTGRGLARVMLGRYREAVRDAEEARRRKPDTPEMMHNVACIFAQAAGRVVADPKEAARQDLAKQYRTAAVRAILDTLALIRPAERARFWREKILPDSALDPIRDSPEFRELLAGLGGAR
jgi:tetratricopeptide (TPR) repeat protein